MMATAAGGATDAPAGMYVPVKQMYEQPLQILEGIQREQRRRAGVLFNHLTNALATFETKRALLYKHAGERIAEAKNRYDKTGDPKIYDTEEVDTLVEKLAKPLPMPSFSPPLFDLVPDNLHDELKETLSSSPATSRTFVRYVLGLVHHHAKTVGGIEADVHRYLGELGNLQNAVLDRAVVRLEKETREENPRLTEAHVKFMQEVRETIQDLKSQEDIIAERLISQPTERYWRRSVMEARILLDSYRKNTNQALSFKDARAEYIAPRKQRLKKLRKGFTERLEGDPRYDPDSWMGKLRDVIAVDDEKKPDDPLDDTEKALEFGILTVIPKHETIMYKITQPERVVLRLTEDETIYRDTVLLSSTVK